MAWNENPLRQFRLSLAECYVELARRYFRWVGPATAAEFQWFSGLGVKAAREAMEPLGLVAAGGGGPGCGIDRRAEPRDLRRGRLVGLWEYSPDERAIVWRTFEGAHDNALLAAVKRTEAFVRDELEDERAFSLDSPKSRAPRIAALRAAGS